MSPHRPHLSGNHMKGHEKGHHAIHPMHRPGPHHAYGGHDGQDRANATKGYEGSAADRAADAMHGAPEGSPTDMAQDAAGMAGRETPPGPSGFPGNMMIGS